MLFENVVLPVNTSLRVSIVMAMLAKLMVAATL